MEALTDISFSWWLHLESASPSSCPQFCGKLLALWDSAVQLLHHSLVPVPPGLLRFSRHAALCKTGFVTQLSWFGLCGKQEVGTTNPAVWIYTLVLLHTFFCSLLEVILYILLLIITFYNVCLTAMNLHGCWTTSGYCSTNR